MRPTFFLLIFVIQGLMAGCGLKVVNPNDQKKEAGTKMLDFSSGKPQVVSTFGCYLKSGTRSFSASAKTEQEARTEVLARCKDATVVSFCKEADIKCEPN